MEPDPYEEQLAKDELLADLAASDPEAMALAEAERREAEAEAFGLVGMAMSETEPLDNPTLTPEARARFEVGLKMSQA
jgi:hypothetical protein